MASAMLTRLVGSSVDTGKSQYKFKSEAQWKTPQATATVNESMSLLDCSCDPTKIGGYLYEMFVTDQVKNNLVSSPHFQVLLDSGSNVAQYAEGFMDTAKRLSDMVARFSESEDRQMIKDVANTVSPDMLKQELATSLENMLTEAPSMDEGVVVLFFFCLDLSTRVVEENHGDLLAVMSLCKEAINKAVNPFVMYYGGWAKVGVQAAKVAGATTGACVVS